MIPGFSEVSSLVFWALLFAFIAIGIWSAWGASPLREVTRPGGPRARELFLPIKFNQAADVPQLGFLRALDLHSATVVSPVFLQRGETIILQMNSLPGYPHEGAIVRGRVIGSRSVGDDPPSFIVKIRFETATTSEQTHLWHYLRGLTHQPVAGQDTASLSHA
jgi:hypothetical protein